ncbi:TetR family transcriptional regulator [Roseibium hamelinense]|uniref:TetR family transcriptional regulator n=1 Tax=Roseibium hamelinense TaxID=150831 RepID=A0A562T9Y7_9HYPH|nr:TetR/AcrR family transcriptional regulator [Roseibium hamelinense]MTI45224.1 TetR/AcrR family transcriptional regulator [Roseibium hamelinense]TWI90412.1 TetR family transcriptional regulator [Roseibium hamelinense]
MQVEKPRRSQAERRAETKAALMNAARSLFVQKGYAETGTPELVKEANVTRGALYHHFSDKADILRAVIHAESQAVADEISAKTDPGQAPPDAFMHGAKAYFTAMKTPGRAHLLLLEGPNVLGLEEMAEIDRQTGQGTLIDGLQHAAAHGQLPAGISIDALADLLSALFDRAALAIASGADEGAYVTATQTLLTGVLKPT